jgi:hypothetical protein
VANSYVSISRTERRVSGDDFFFPFSGVKTCYIYRSRYLPCTPIVSV